MLSKSTSFRFNWTTLCYNKVNQLCLGEIGHNFVIHGGAVLGKSTLFWCNWTILCCTCWWGIRYINYVLVQFDNSVSYIVVWY